MIEKEAYDLYSELQLKTRQLDASVRQLRKSGTEYAQAEHDYKVLLRVECLKLRDEGMAIGMIQMTAYGIPQVAELRMKRTICEATYRANLEAIASIKLQMRLIENQIQREWGASEQINTI